MSRDLVVFYFIGILATLSAGAIVYLVSLRKYIRPLRVLPVLLIGFSSYLFFAQYFKYKSLHFYTDFSHWIGLLQTIVTTGKPWNQSVEFIIPGALNYFSVHFVPLIYFFVIPFKMITRPEMLLFLNVAVMMSAVIPLYKLAAHLHSSKYFALFVGSLFLWYPTFQYITLYEFEMLRFSIPILFWMLYFFEKRCTALFFLFMIAAVLVREEMGLTVAMFGVYAWIFRKRWMEGFAAMLLGLGGFILITSVVMPAFRSGEYVHVAAGGFAPFGRTPLEVLSGVATHPLLAAQIMLAPDKIANIFMLGLPLLFLPFIAFSALFGAVANIGIGLLSEGVVHISYMLYYIAPSVPFIFYAFLKAWPRFISLSFWERGGVRVEGALMSAFLAAVLISNVFFGPSPISLQFWFKNIQPAPFRTQNFHWSVYRATDHHRKVEEFVRMIPDDAIVSTQQFLAPRLYKKQGVMVFPQLVSKDGMMTAGYVFFDTTNHGLRPESPAFMRMEDMTVVRDSDDWERIATTDGYELYRRRL